MTALIWMLTWLPQVLSAMSELPQPVNLTLSSNHFRHVLRWQPGPGTPTGVSYRVTSSTDRTASWVPVPGCEQVQHPLVCNLTEVFSDPRQNYLVQIVARLEEGDSLGVIYQGFRPIRETDLDLPRLTVTACGRDLCVDLQPPMEHLRNVYDSLVYNLKIESNKANSAQILKDIESLRRQTLKDLAPGRQYCVSVRIWDKLESRESNYSQPVCGVTSTIYTADPWISAVFCLLVVFGLVVLVLLVVTGFICLRGKPLPLVLTSIRHIEGALFIVSCRASLSSLLTVKAALPSSGGKRSSQSLSDESDEEGGTVNTPGSRGGYKLQVGTNLMSSSSSSSSSLSASLSPEAEPQPGRCSNQTSDLFSPLPKGSPDTHSSAGLNLTPGRHMDSLTAETEEEGGGTQGVNLLTLTFGGREEEELHLDVAEVECRESHSASEENNVAPIQPSQPWDTEEVTIETVFCSTDEEEEEEDEHSGYMGRPCADILQNLL